MKRFYLLATIAALSGCQSVQPPNERALAQQRWQGARAQVVCSVGNEYLKVGDLDKAQVSASDAIKLDAKSVPAHVLLAKVWLEKGQYGQSLEELHKAQPLAPERAEIPYLMGVALEKQSELGEALKSYQVARGLDQTNNAYVMASAEVMVAMGNVTEALTVLAGRLAKSEGDAGMLALAGDVALLADEPAKAVDFYQRCQDMQPDSPTAREGLAKARFFSGQYKTALEDLSRLAAVEPYKDKCSWVYIMMGDCHSRLGQSAQAKSAYETASTLEPGEVQVWLELARSALAVKDSARAILSARRALTIEPDHAEASLMLGYAQFRQGQIPAAQATLETAVAQHPDDPMLRCALGRCYAAQGLSQRAADCYTQALKADPQMPLAKSLLALSNADVGPVSK